MTVPRPVASDSPAQAPLDADIKGQPPGAEASSADEVVGGCDSAADSATAAARVMKQTSKTSAEGGDCRHVKSKRS
jgi:hypothetical protein